MNVKRHDGMVHAIYMVTPIENTPFGSVDYADMQTFVTNTAAVYSVTTHCGRRTKLYGGGKTRFVETPLNCLQCIGEESHEK